MNLRPQPSGRFSILSVILSMTCAVSVSRAVPFASGITNNAGTISFILNESADNVKVIFDGGANTNDLGARAKGLHSFSLGAASTWEIHVSKSVVPGWTMTSDDLNPLVRFYAPRGIASFNNPADLSRFGRIYVASTAAGTITAAPTSSARYTGKGFYVINADQSDALGFGNTEQTGGLSFHPTSPNSPFKIELGEDNLLYIGDFQDAYCTVYRTDADVSSSSGEVVLAGIGNTANPTVHTTINGSPIAKGSLGAGTLQVWASDGQMAGNFNRLMRWDIGAGPLPYNSPPTMLAYNSITSVADTQSDLDIAPDGKFFFSQNRATGTGGYDSTRVNLRVLDTDGLTVLWDSFSNSVAIGQSADVFNGSRAVKVSPDGRRFAFIRNSTETWIVGITNGIPDITSRLLLNTFGATTTTSSNGREVSWDAAGNLLAANTTHEKLRVWSPGGTTRAITRSAGAFEVVVPETLVSATATTPTANEAGPVHGVIRLTRTGDTSGALTVYYTVSGTATSGSDYIALPGSVTFAAGATTTNITVTVLDDAIAEFTETVILTITGGTGYGIGSPGSATVSILDNEPAELSISVTQSNLLESFSGARATFQVTRKGLLTPALTANIAYSGTATLATDFNGPSTVAILANVVNTNFNITPINDQAYEGTETVIASVGSGTGYVIGSPASATAVVIDDDLPATTTLFIDKYDTEMSVNNWVVNAPGGQAYADFGYNYSADGIPEAPSSTGTYTPTRGLKFRVNETEVLVNGLSVSPTNGNFTGDYRLRFDMWINFVGPLLVGGTGSTEHLNGGVGTTGVEPMWHGGGATEGVWFTTSGDGQVGDITQTNQADYGVFIGSTLQAGSSGYYVAGTNDASRGNNDPYYSLWGGVGAPASQTTAYPTNQTGTTSIGAMGMSWHTVTITKQGTNVTWDIDGRRIATVNISALSLSTNVFVGYMDWYPSISPVPAVQFGLVDNVRVENLVPLPTTPPVITAIQIVGGNVEIFFTGEATDTPSSFKLQSSGTVATGYADVSATINSLGGVSFRAVRAVGGSQQYYRIRRQ